MSTKETTTHSTSNQFSRRQIDREHILIQQRLRDFDPANCEASRYLVNKFGGLFDQKQLKKIALTLSYALNIPLDREATRRKMVMIKWFDENIDTIRPFIDNSMVITDENQNPVGNYDKDLLKLFYEKVREESV